MTEQQPYDVLHSYDDFELRRYPGHLLAEAVVDAPFEDAGNKAFRYLFAYIGGENVSNSKVAMTAPVVQADASSRIAMTAPVVQQPASANPDDGESSGFRVAFVLPADFAFETAPRPTNPRVQLRAVPESLVAAIRYRGRWTEESYLKHLEQLTSALAVAGFTSTGQPRFARFDPPFLPAFLRHNEVMLDVEESQPV
ncbi:heme-binding protein [Subtercola sp. PAMC28395]|uniref:SOUL family heme-binding protein n=1 Tax=Subtercola sp. PAMC28395 TaxID=2846775 RepID=UPI001C0C7428|nr:heme-binding protein [Subtercola sp. PAMC28395]QWT24095.1 heme-binding protein [Subtercola sp. PAMC28395]